jgi:NAD(P)H-nitrite reductase large subunit
VPEARIVVSPGFEDGRGIRLVFSGEKLVGATLVGKVRDAGVYERLIRERQAVWDSRDELLREDTAS